MKNKKITIYAINLGFGGIEKYVSTLANALVENNEVNIVVTYKTMETSAFKVDDKVKIKYLVNGDPYNVSIKTLIKGKKIFQIPFELIRRTYLKLKAKKMNILYTLKLKSDIVITTRTYHNKIVNKYSKKNIIKIATEHNYLIDDEIFVRKLISSVSNFDYFLVATNELFEFYNKKLNGVKCKVMPYSIDFISKNKTNFNSNNIISVGRFSKEKGFIDLIDVMRHIVDENPNIKLFLIGDGPEIDNVKEHVKNKGLENNVVLPGFLSHGNLEQYLLGSSLYVMTSYSEAFGLVLIEAMNYGLPLIAFNDASGPREVISERNGVLLPRNNKKMATEIIKLMNNKKDLIKYQENINEDIHKYSFENFKEFWNSFLKSKDL